MQGKYLLLVCKLALSENGFSWHQHHWTPPRHLMPTLSSLKWQLVSHSTDSKYMYAAATVWQRYIPIEHR